MDEVNDISSVITIKNRLSNKMDGSFVLYRTNDEDIEANLVIKQHNGDDLRSVIGIKVEKHHDIDASIDVMYRGNTEIQGGIEAIAVNFLESYIEVRPHNQMFGGFELFEAPRVEVTLSPVADATTRSRDDLRTINYGDTRSMLTGKSPDEEFGAFVQFADFQNSIPDLKFIESAKLRLYYASFPLDSDLALHQPNTIWRELGITDANKPHSVELLHDSYTINTIDRYVEFDIMETALRWQSGTLENYGLILSTTDDNRLTFLTRESDRSPQLIIKYVTSQVYSIGRSEMESSIFVYGKKNYDISGVLTVDSDVGIYNLESYLYVHRQADYLYSDIPSKIPISKPELFSFLTIQKREYTEIDATLTVAVHSMTEVESNVSSSKPDIDSSLTIDPKISLASLITIAKPMTEDINFLFAISKPDLASTLTVSDHTRANNYLDSELTVRTEYESFMDSTLSISIRDMAGLLTVRAIDQIDMDGIIQVPDKFDVDSTLGYSHPDLKGTITIRAIGNEYLDSSIEVPYYEDLPSTFGYSHPDLSAVLTVTYTSEVDGEMYVKDKEYLDGLIDVKKINEISGYLMVKAVNQIDSEISVNRPELFGYLSPRVVGENELIAEILIKKRNVADLNSYISVRGQGNRNFVILF
ncbi:DNRLRE domain-containing protein [Paenibacillus sp. FSL E2-0178]|uniref:DNRLRE domain-containing protein n=1 Tax=Paenibacillus sp. FSL E2-0178 TaxID=2921361 RepID=UPI0031580B8E